MIAVRPVEDVSKVVRKLDDIRQQSPETFDLAIRFLENPEHKTLTLKAKNGRIGFAQLTETANDE